MIGSFDSSVHISEEASNAATAVPWAIVNAIGIAGVLGWGECVLSQSWTRHMLTVVNTFQPFNMALAFCMGPDLQSLIDSDPAYGTNILQ